MEHSERERNLIVKEINMFNDLVHGISSNHSIHHHGGNESQI